MRLTFSINGILVIILAGIITGCSDNGSNEESNAFFVVKVNTPDSSNDYSGLTIQFGTSDNATVLAESTIDNDGQATLNIDINQYASQTVWFCIPGVVKYFHPLTAAEIDAQTLTLPDKDKGSTLQTTEGSPQVGGRYIVNDWIVALYMGVNKDGKSDTVPLYWATGNVIATKTNVANSDCSEVAFHIATFQESCNEAKVGGTDFLCNDARLIGESADGYVAIDAGEQWDLFGFGDASGVALYLNYKKKYVEVTKQIQGGSYIYDVSGNADCDIATAHIGALWRTPTGGNGAYNEFAALEDNSEEYLNLQPDGTNWYEGETLLGFKYEYEIKEKGKALTTNTLYIPAAGYSHGSFTDGRGTTGFYWSATADPTCTPPYVPNGTYQGEVKEYTTAFNYGFMNGEAKWYPHPRVSGQSVRPVCE